MYKAKSLKFFPSSFHQVKNVKKLMNVTMCDNFLCKWDFGLTHDTICQIISKCLVKNIDCKTQAKKYIMKLLKKVENKMKTHLVKENGSKKCNGKIHNKKNNLKNVKH
jgi:hypothetical protein